MFTYLAHASPLHRLNPAAKLVGVAFVALGATLAFDPYIPAALLVGLWLAAWILGRIPIGRMLRASAIILAVPLPLVVFTALFAEIDPTRAHIWFHFGPWTLSQEGLLLGLGLGLRVGTFLAGSLLYISTTDPSDFAVSLIQNVGVPDRLGYGLLVSYRFLPTLREEFSTIRLAHQVRGIGHRAGLGGRIEEVRRLAVPLLAGAIRRSERTALAMDARGFGAAPGRTYFRLMAVRGRDRAFALACGAYAGAVYLTAISLGLARLQWIPGA